MSESKNDNNNGYLESYGTSHNNNPAKTWCFTLFPEESEIVREGVDSPRVPSIEAAMRDIEGVSLLTAGREICSDTQRFHYQGCITYKKAQRFTAVRRLFHQKAHWEKAREASSAHNYCMKDGDYLRIDNRCQGKRTDIDELKEGVMRGDSVRKLWNDNFGAMLRYHNGVAACRATMQATSGQACGDDLEFNIANIDWDSGYTHILWGESGTGKTQFAINQLPDALFVSHIDQLKQFDESEHKGIIFDDMDFKHWPRESQIHLVDADQLRAINCRYANGTIPAKTKKIFTTNKHGGGVVDLDDAAVRRRCVVTEINESLFA